MNMGLSYFLEGEVYMINGEPWTVVKTNNEGKVSVTLVKGYFTRDELDKNKWYLRRVWNQSAIHEYLTEEHHRCYDFRNAGERTITEIKVRDALKQAADFWEYDRSIGDTIRGMNNALMADFLTETIIGYLQEAERYKHVIEKPQQLRDDIYEWLQRDEVKLHKQALEILGRYHERINAENSQKEEAETPDVPPVQ